MTMRTIPVLALTLGSTMLWAQFDEPMRQHDAHVHGEARGNLSVDARSLAMTLDIPAFNLVGFEHRPADAEQQALLDGVLGDLESLNWIDTDPAADCTTSSVEIAAPGLVGDGGRAEDDHGHHHAHDDTHLDHQAEGHDHAHDHDHDHDHDHEHEHGESHDHAEHHRGDDSHDHHDHDHGHGSFEVTVALDCAQASALRWVDIDLFSDYPNNSLIRLDVLTDAVVKQVDLRPGRIRVDLTP